MKKLLQFLLNYPSTHLPIHPSTHPPIHPSTHPPIHPSTHSLKKHLLILSFFLFPFLVGCATKTTPVFVTIKSPQIKISDEGFLKEGIGYKEIIIYKLGNVPLKFILKEDVICINDKCINKYTFMQKYFSGYNKDFFDKILNKKPILNNNIKKTDEGFIQKSTNFTYIVKKDSVLFKDRKKGIVIFIKYLKDS